MFSRQKYVGNDNSHSYYKKKIRFYMLYKNNYLQITIFQKWKIKLKWDKMHVKAKNWYFRMTLTNLEKNFDAGATF